MHYGWLCQQVQFVRAGNKWHAQKVKMVIYKNGLQGWADAKFIGKGVSKPTHTQGNIKLLGRLLIKGRVQIRDNG